MRARRRHEDYSDPPASAGRAFEASLQTRQRESHAARADQCLEVELPAIFALPDRLQTLAASPRAAHVNTPAETARRSDCFDLGHENEKRTRDRACQALRRQIAPPSFG